MNRFSVGDKVHVEFDGVVKHLPGTSESYRCGYIVTDDRNHNYHEVFDNSLYSSVIARTDPANWPPKANDVWYSEKTHDWFHVFTAGVIRRTGMGGTVIHEDVVLRNYPDIVLKFRT
jgi:hypothetical protein